MTLERAGRVSSENGNLASLSTVGRVPFDPGGPALSTRYASRNEAMANPVNVLELRRGLAGDRHYLDGRRVNGGDILQLCFSGGWVTGRYEWVPDDWASPRFHCSIELLSGEVAEHVLEIPHQALVRWPV